FEGSFANKALFRVEAGALEIAAPNKVLSGLIERRFGDLVREATRSELGEFPVKFVVAADLFGPGAVASTEAEEPAPASPAPRAKAASPQAVAARSGPSERYRLDNFIVGESNRLAYKAAVRLAEGESAGAGAEGDPASYSPLFIHGPCGV